MSLRDQMLQAGLISQKQAREADREAQRRSQPPPKHKRDAPRPPSGQANSAPPAAAGGASVPPATRPNPSAPSRVAGPGSASATQGAKAARDQALNRQREEKAKKKAMAAQIKQLVEQNRVPPIESEDWYNFVAGTKIRRIAVDAAVRRALVAGQLVIVRHAGGYDLVPAAVAERVRERDASAVIARVAPAATAAEASAKAAEDPYAAFAVPDDLMW